MRRAIAFALAATFVAACSYIFELPASKAVADDASSDATTDEAATSDLTDAEPTDADPPVGDHEARPAADGP
jgi:hypothetical protein